MKELWRTNIVIYTPFDPSQMELSDLSEEATGGLAYCESQEVTRVADEDLPDGARAFFNVPDSE